MHHHKRLFFCSWPRCLSAAAGCTYIVGCGYRVPGRLGGCRNGEVWTSPRRESPRLPGSNQPPGGTSSPKADGLYKSCWRIAAPHGAAFTAGPRRRAQVDSVGPADLVTVPAPGRQVQGWARCKGPPMLPNPHQPTSAAGEPLKMLSHKTDTKQNLFSRIGTERGGGPHQNRPYLPPPAGEGKTRRKPGFVPSPRSIPVKFCRKLLQKRQGPCKIDSVREEVRS